MKTYKLAAVAMMALAGSEAFAGGLFTNTNQNPIFFRQPAQNAVVGVQGAYYNPAGLTLMDKGWHFYVGNQTAIQSRQVESTYAPFALGAKNGAQSTKTYEGNTFSPIIPSIDAVYNHDKWAASFHFGVISGGGSCAFEDGLGSFESAMALLPVTVNAIAGTKLLPGYDSDINFTGKSYGFGGQLNFSYKLFENEGSALSLAAGLRMNYLMNDYSGGIYNYQLNYGGQLTPAANVITGVLGQLGIPAAQAAAYGQALGADKEVACKQKDIAWTPVLSAHYRVGAADFAVKYEFNTKVRYENDTQLNTANIASFADGATVPSDIPALLSAGVGVKALPCLRVYGAYNMFFDKNANYNGKEDLLGKNTSEYMAGIEWDVCKKLTLSAGTQITRFDFGDNYAYLSDMSFSLNSWCLGGGLRYKFTDRLAVDVSAFKTFYEHATKTYTDYGGAAATYANALKGLVPESLFSNLPTSGTDIFYRTSLTFGIGVAYSF